MTIALLLLMMLFIIYFLLAAALYFFQDRLLYTPSPKYDHKFKELKIENQGEQISVIVLNEGKHDALIYFGGNAEAVVLNAEDFQSAFPEKTTYLVNYRGFGGSTGKPSESGLLSDALVVYDQIKPSHQSISIAGRSLGSGVAVYLAANREITKTVLVTPYDSVLNVGKGRYPIFPIKLLLKDDYDSAARAEKVTSPVLVIAAEYDQVVPVSHAEKLVNRFPAEQVEYKVIERADHNNLSDTHEYYEYFTTFLKASSSL